MNYIELFPQMKNAYLINNVMGISSIWYRVVNLLKKNCLTLVRVEGNIHEIPKSVRCKKHALKEHNHIRQYLRGLTICLCSRSCRDFTILKKKNTRCSSTVFSLKNYVKPYSPKQQFFYFMHRIHNRLPNGLK